MAVADHVLSLSALTGSYLDEHQFQASLGYRYLHADRIFVGTQDVTPAGGSPIVDDIDFFDLVGTYAVTRRIDLSLDVPFMYGQRYSTPENEGHGRTATAGGLGDVRLDGSFWLLDPVKHPGGNISLGVGVKAPTGQDDATDLFYRSGSLVRRPVHVSIQPGDGGWGLILEMEAFKTFFGRAMVYAAGSYLINPRNQNGVELTIADDLPELAAQFGRINSVPDQYVGRVGVAYALWPKLGLSVTLGGRVEGIPVHDVIGGSDGYRASGYAVSIEPGLAITRKLYTFTLSAPVAVERDREPSVPNILAGIEGPASFANFLILASISRRF